MHTNAPTALTRRPLTLDDTAAWADLLAACEVVDHTGENYSTDDLVEELEDPTLAAADDTVGVFGDDGALLAYGLVRAPATAGEVHQVSVEGCVRPDHRRRGLGSEVFGWTVERARRLHGTRHPDRPGEVHARCHDGNDGVRAIVAAHGLEPVRYWYSMAVDLTGELAAARPVDGVRVEEYDPARDDEARIVRNEAFADHWGSVQRDASEWQQWYTGSRSFRAPISLLAIDEPTGDVVGVCLSYEYEADVAATGVREAWIGQLGTRRAWRGRGIASALLTEVLRRYRDHGYQRGALDVDTSNPTGALGIYERVGFVPTERWTTYARPL